MGRLCRLRSHRRSSGPLAQDHGTQSANSGLRKKRYRFRYRWGNVIVDDILGNTQNNYTYTPGKFLRFLGFEILWFLKSPDRFKTHPNWFKFFGKNIFYQDLEFTDLKSFLFGTWGNIRKLCNPKFRQTKKGTNK